MRQDQPCNSWQGSATQNADRTLRRIAERDGALWAWTHVDAAGALAQAAALDDLPVAARGPLHGMLVGVKDVIDVAGMPTSHNSLLGNARPALADAPCVSLLRSAGAIIVGKTDTTELPPPVAMRQPPTHTHLRIHRADLHRDRLPRSPTATLPFALATQTGGSTIRPASFCGIPALKPT